MEQRDERLIGNLTHIDDLCRRQGVSAEPVMGEIEHVIQAVRPVREASEKAGLNSRERKVVAEAISDAIREGMR